MTTYGAALYGAGVTPDRIHSLLQTAQAATARKTALRVSVLDTQVNRWSEFAGTALTDPVLLTSSTDRAYSVDQAYKGYQLGMGMCLLSGGSIIRVRVGDGSLGNRNIYVQVITSPTTTAQWTSWTLLYSGTHYGVAVMPVTSTTYRVYSAKADGIYADNVLAQAITGVIQISPVVGQLGAMFVTKVRTDTVDAQRVMDLYYSPNVATTGFSDDTLNYRWHRTQIAALLLADGRVARAQVAGFYTNPRSLNLAESITISFGASYTSVDPVAPPVLIRGFAGQAGSNAIVNPHLTLLADGYYYLFYSEVRYDADKTVAISATGTLFWQRSEDLIHWSEPVAIGYPGMNPTGVSVVEAGGYQEEVMALGPTAYWRLGEASGTTAVDQTGAHDGTIVNAVGYGAAGALVGDTDTAMTFNGGVSAARITVGAPVQTVIDDWTIMAWVKPPTVGATRMVAYVGTSVTNGYGLYIGATGIIAGYAYGATLPNIAIGTTVLTPGVWYFAVLLRRAGTSRLYLNGVPHGTTGAGVPLTPTGGTQIGNVLGGTVPMSGGIDEVAIWDRALADSEIAALYAAGTGTYTSYAYLGNNSSVYRRSTDTITYDISDYVPSGELELPKSNQAGTGDISIANPLGVNDALLDLTDCEVTVEVGLLCSDGTYRYVEFGRWWIDKVTAEIFQRTSRLKLTLYDLWRRLDNPLRDNYNNVGCVVWRDWGTALRNQLFNYYPKGGTYAAVPVSTYAYVQVTGVTTKNFCLYTGWKGHNGAVEARFRAAPTTTKKLGMVYRYRDDNNYYWAYADGATIYLTRVVGGVSTTMSTGTKAISGWFTMKVDFRWGIHRVYINGVLEKTYNEALSGDSPGYAGVRGTAAYGFYQFSFDDWQRPITTNDLITTLLAMGDFHSPSVAGGEATQLAIVWGPQTDLNTPAKALLSLCEQFKLDLAWRGGRVEVGQFKELTIVHTYENEVIDCTRSEEVGRRINLAAVDGREDSWIEIDGPDTRFRGRQIVSYFDVPELTTDDAVRLRAQEEIRKGVVGSAYEANMPLQLDLWRMDGITITDSNGTAHDLQVEGMKIQIEQGMSPVQRMTLELSPLT